MRKLLGYNLSTRGMLLLGYGLAAGQIVTPPDLADYIATNNAELAAIFALGNATLDGKTIELDGTFTPVSIPSLVFTTPTTIRGAAGNLLHGIDHTGNCTNVIFRDLNVQVQGWPRARTSCIHFNLHLYTSCKWINCDLSHGYGPTLAPIDTSAVLPEYQRILHSGSAGTAGASQALTWPALTGDFGWIEFWNDSAEPLYVKVSTNAVDTATASDITVGPNQRYSPRITNLPSTATHIHVSASATTVNWRCTTEKGLANWLANAFDSGGTSRLLNCQFIGCHLHDLSNAFKFWPAPAANSTLVWMDNRTSRIYQDILAKGYPQEPGTHLMTLRNTWCQPFCLSGIDNLLGDAQDPHGDLWQFFGGNTWGRITSAGNRTVRGNLRAGAGNQGAHFWAGGNFRDSAIINDQGFLNSNNGITVGGPSEDTFVFGSTILNPESPIGTNGGRVNIDTANGSDGYFAKCMVNSDLTGARTVKTGNVILQGGTITTRMPNFANALTATDRAGLDAAMAAAPAYAGAGAADNAHVIDWLTTDPNAVIKWDQLPTGLDWPDTVFLAPSTLVTTQIRKVLVGPAVSTITAEPGTEYRITSDRAGTVVVTDWTSAAGTVNRGQYVQLRGMSSPNSLEAVNLGVTVNGFLTQASMRTRLADPAAFFTVAGAGPAFSNSGTIGGSRDKIAVRLVLRRTANPAAAETLYSHNGTDVVFEVLNNGSFRTVVKDNFGATILSNVVLSATNALPLNVWSEIIWQVDLTNLRMLLRVNGVLLYDQAIPANSGFFNGSRYPIFLAKSTGGTSQWSAGNFAELQMWFDASLDGFAPAGTPYKSIIGDAATVNADPWQIRADAT